MRGIGVWSSVAELQQRADQHERLARGPQGAADEVRDHLAEDHDGEADQGVVEAALGSLDGPDAAAGGARTRRLDGASLSSGPSPGRPPAVPGAFRNGPTWAFRAFVTPGTPARPLRLLGVSGTREALDRRSDAQKLSRSRPPSPASGARSAVAHAHALAHARRRALLPRNHHSNHHM